jgi:hypothetical protein
LWVAFARSGLYWLGGNQGTEEGFSGGRAAHRSGKLYLRDQADVFAGRSVAWDCPVRHLVLGQGVLSVAVARIWDNEAAIWERAELSSLSVGQPAEGIIRLRSYGFQSCSLYTGGRSDTKMGNRPETGSKAAHGCIGNDGP